MAAIECISNGRATIIHGNLVCLIIVAYQSVNVFIKKFICESLSPTTFKMFIQTDKALIATLAFDEAKDIMYRVKRVRPFIALCPHLVRTCPSPACILCFHESSFRVEYSKGCPRGKASSSILLRRPASTEKIRSSSEEAFRIAPLVNPSQHPQE